MDQIELIQKQCDLQKQEIEVLSKNVGFEFDKVQKAFSQMGNLLDLLYLETSVTLEMLFKNKVIDQAEFTKNMEETAKKVQEEIKNSSEKKEESPIITKV